MKSVILILLFVTINISINGQTANTPKARKLNPLKISKYDSLFIKKEDYIAKSFRYPVGKPEMEGYFISRPFGFNGHLGCDFSCVGGSEDDLGDPIYASASGYVVFAKDEFRSWGATIRIVHKTNKIPKYVVSMYAHCDTMYVKEGDWVKQGDLLGTIGNSHGLYSAHLHFEIRYNLNIEYGEGYSKNRKGFYNPKKFMDEWGANNND